MDHVVCPNCNAHVPELATAEGWCESCGKKLPLFAYRAAGLEPPPTHQSVQASAPPRASGGDTASLQGQAVLFGLFCGLVTILALWIKRQFGLDNDTLFLSLLPLGTVAALVGVFWYVFSKKRKEKDATREDAEKPVG